MVQFNPHLEALQISLPFDEVNSNDLATLAHGCRRLHTVGPYAVFNERILSTMPRGTAFHKVRNLICRDMKEADMSARSGTCTISKVRHCLDILQKRMPRLEYLWIPNWFDVVIDDLLLVDTIDIVMLSENVEGSDSPLDSIYGYQQMELDAPSVELKLKILDAR